MTTFQGSFAPGKIRIGIVVSEFNEFITNRLLGGALDCLCRHGVPESAVDIAKCPGAFEIAQAARRMASSSAYDALICLGCVIRGETPHFEYVASAAATGIQKLSLETDIPVIFGVLTTHTLEQAIDRAGAKGGNKGWDCAMAALQMADLFGKLRPRKK